MRICPNCSAENSDKDLFCVKCGSSLRNSEVINKKPAVGMYAPEDDEDGFLDEDDPQAEDEPDLDDYDQSEDLEYDIEFKRQMKRYMLEQGSLKQSEKKRKGRLEDKKTVLVGVILILAVIVGGILAFNAFSGKFSNQKTRTATARLSDDMIKELTREKEAETDLEQAQEDGEEQETEQETAEVTQAPETPSVSAKLMLASDLDNEGYQRVEIVDASASSVIDQEGFDNSAIRGADGNENTSWQEGVDGPGIGETIEYVFDREYMIHSMTFKLGNWASEQYFWANNRPETITIWLDQIGYEVTFPDGMKEYAILFSEDIPASNVQFEINSVYEGTEYDDTCITDIGIYGA